MKRKLLRLFRLAIVSSLVVSLGTSPASAGWLLHQLRCRSANAQAVTPVCPPICMPAPVCPPVIDCCGAVQGLPSQVIHGPHRGEVEADSSADAATPPADSLPDDQDTLRPSRSDDRETPDPVAPQDAPAASDRPRPTAPRVEPTPAPVPEDMPDPARPRANDPFGQPPAPAPARPAEDADDLFAEPPAAEPAQPAPPADDLFSDPPASQPAPAVDDLFGDPRAPAPAPEAAPLDDLFGDPPAQPAAPAEDDIFGTPSDTPAETTPPADGLLDNLFGEPGASAPPADSADDLFGAPEEEATDADATDDGGSDESLDDLFGSPAAEASDLFEDLFGGSLHNSDQQRVSVEIRTSIDPLSEADQRVWIDNTGGFSTEGRLVEIGEDFIRLLKSNGRTCTVPMSRLCAADAAYVQSIRAELQQYKVAMLSAR